MQKQWIWTLDFFLWHFLSILLNVLNKNIYCIFKKFYIYHFLHPKWSINFTSQVKNWLKKKITIIRYLNNYWWIFVSSTYNLVGLMYMKYIGFYHQIIINIHFFPFRVRLLTPYIHFHKCACRKKMQLKLGAAACLLHEKKALGLRCAPNVACGKDIVLLRCSRLGIHLQVQYSFAMNHVKSSQIGRTGKWRKCAKVYLYIDILTTLSISVLYQMYKCILGKKGGCPCRRSS